MRPLPRVDSSGVVDSPVHHWVGTGFALPKEGVQMTVGSEATPLGRVILPLALPGLGAVAIYAFIETWDEFLFARTFVVSSERWTASVGLYSFEGQYVVPQQQVMAAAILFALPPMVLFLFVRRAFIAGLGAGAVKG